MKYLSILLVICFLSCGKQAPKETYRITYQFENPDAIDDSAVLRTVNTIKNRLNQFTRDYELLIGKDKRLELTIRTDVDIVRLNTLVSNEGALEFWECLDLNTASEFIYMFDEEVSKNIETTTSSNNFTIEQLLEETTPFSSLFGPPDYSSNSFFTVAVKDTALVNNYMNSHYAKAVKRNEYRNIDLLYGHLPVNDVIGVFFCPIKPE